MNPRIPAACAAMLVLLTACGGGGSKSVLSPTTGAHTPSTSPSPSGPEEAMAQSVLNPGTTYVPSKFRPTFTFSVRDPWWLDGEGPTALVMTPGTFYTSTKNLLFLDVERVFPPSDQRHAVAAPKDLVSWFLHHPGLRFLVRPHPVDVGGIRGSEFVVTAVNLPPCVKNPNLPRGTRCWLLAPFGPGDPFSPAQAAMGPPFGVFTDAAGKAEWNLFVVLDVHGQHVLIGFDDDPGEFRSSVRLAEQLIQTSHFG